MDDMDAETAAAFCIFIFFIMILGLIGYNLYLGHIQALNETEKCFELLNVLYTQNATEANKFLSQQISTNDPSSSVSTKLTNVINERCWT